MHSRILNDESSVLVTELCVFGNYLNDELCAHQCDAQTRVLKGGDLLLSSGNRAEEQMRKTTGIILTIGQMHPNGVVSPYGWVSIWAAMDVWLQMTLNAQQSRYT